MGEHEIAYISHHNKSNIKVKFTSISIHSASSLSHRLQKKSIISQYECVSLLFVSYVFRFEAILMVQCCMMTSFDPEPIFRADHPFTYFIFDAENKCPVFTGGYKRNWNVESTTTALSLIASTQIYAIFKWISDSNAL